MPELDLDAIEAREQAATEGPWWSDDSDMCWRLHGVAYRISPVVGGGIPEQIVNKQIIKAPKHGTPYAEYWPEPADAEFIAHAREDVRLLVDEVKRLRARDAHIHDELRGRRSDDLNVRGILSPQPGTAPDPGIPFPLGPRVAPAVEWLVAEVRRLQGILEDQYEDWRGGPA